MSGLSVRNSKGIEIFNSEITPYRLLGNVLDFSDDPRLPTFGVAGVSESAIIAARVPIGVSLQWNLSMRVDDSFPSSIWVPGTGNVQVPAHHNLIVGGWRRSTDAPATYYIYDRLPPDRVFSGFGIQTFNSESEPTLNSSVKQMMISEVVSVDVEVINNATPKSYIGTFPNSLIIANNLFSKPQEHADDVDARVLIERTGDSYSAYMRLSGNLDPVVQLNGTYRVDCIFIDDHEA